MEGFVGNGALKRVIPKLIEEGWDDVPTLKLMKSEDMDAINMTQQQKDALKMRSYLHDCALIQYGDKLESSGKSLQELLGLSTNEISSQFGMKRGHIARFMERGISNSSAPDPLQQPPQALTSSRKTTKTSSNNSIHKVSKMDPMLYKEAVGDKEEPELVSQINWFSRLFSWINWSNRSDKKLSKEKMGGKENEDNDDDVLYLMQYINGQQQLELQLTSSKNTVLHVAAQFGNKKYVEKLLEKSPSSLLRCLNIDGETPFHIAVREGHLDIVKALIECAKRLDHKEVESGGGATKEMLRAQNKDNDTALHMAVRNPHNLDVVELLTKEDREFIHPPNNAKEAPLYLAAERQRDGMVSTILKNCKSPAYGGPKGQTALHVAASHSSKTESTKLLLEWNLDLIKETDGYGWIPLHYAARYDNVIGVNIILEKDKSVAYITTDEEGNEKTAFHIAAAHGNVRVMEELLSQCPDCWEMVNSKGQNILHIALDVVQEKVTEYILKKSWIIHLINQKDNEGNTPLHLLATAVEFRMRDIRFKLWYHFNKHATNNNNMTPQDVLLHFIAEDKLNWSSLSQFVRGRTIVQMDQEFITKLKKARKEEREREKIQAKERGKGRVEENNKRAQTHLIVATLIATVTFAAGFTMPGGYDGNQGPKQGMPILLRHAAFKVFVITNTLAMICSISAAFLYASASFYNDATKQEHRHLMAFWLILIAMGTMVVAFITGTYSVLSHSLGIAIATGIGTCSFFIFIPEVIKLFKYEYILNPDHARRLERARIRSQG